MKDVGKPRLRFDKVALRFVGSVKQQLINVLPQGTTVIFTVTAPIRFPSKTASELDAYIRTRLDRDSMAGDVRTHIFGNNVCVRIRTGTKRASEVHGFVHTPDPEGEETLLDRVQALVD